MHDPGVHFNMGHPKKFVGAVLHNAFQAGDTASPKVKLLLNFLDHLTKFTIDSCIREYQDWTTGSEDRTFPEEHFVWLSNEFAPFRTDLGTPCEPPDFTLGLPHVGDWPPQTGDPLWILDPAEHRKPAWARHSHQKSTSLSSADESKKRNRKKKHRQTRKPELKVTTRAQGDDAPIWSHPGCLLSSSLDSQTEATVASVAIRSKRTMQGPLPGMTTLPSTVRIPSRDSREVDWKIILSATGPETVMKTKRWLVQMTGLKRPLTPYGHPDKNLGSPLPRVWPSTWQWCQRPH